MALHSFLEKHFRWYKEWHKNPYSEKVHYIILLVASLFDLYLGIRLITLINKI